MGKKVAILCGLNYTPLPSGWHLSGCINDVNLIKNMLIDAYDYQEQDIYLFRDDINSEDRYPTQSNIIGTLTNLCSLLTYDDELWFHYSGHGYSLEDKNNNVISNEQDNKNEIIFLYDNNAKNKAVKVYDDELHTVIATAKCKVIMIFDACNSGTIGDLPWNYRLVNKDKYKDSNDNKNNSPIIVRSRENNSNIENKQIYIISSARDDQTSADTYDPLMQVPLGILTMALLYCLRANRHSVSIPKLFCDIAKYIKDNGYNQTPRLSSSSMNPNGFISKYDNIEIIGIESIIST